MERYPRKTKKSKPNLTRENEIILHHFFTHYYFHTRIITLQSKLSKYILTNQNDQNIFLCYWINQFLHMKWPILPFGIAKFWKSVSATYHILTLCDILRFISWYILYCLIVNITRDTVKWQRLFILIWCNCRVFFVRALYYHLS